MSFWSSESAKVDQYKARLRSGVDDSLCLSLSLDGDCFVEGERCSNFDLFFNSSELDGNVLVDASVESLAIKDWLRSRVDKLSPEFGITSSDHNWKLNIEEKNVIINSRHRLEK